jgi:hypothetical protein
MTTRSNRTAPMHLTENTSDEVVATNDGLLMVDLWADWCAPCHAMAPVLEDLAANSGGRVNLAQLNVEARTRACGQARHPGDSDGPLLQGRRSLIGSPAPCQQPSSRRSWTREREPRGAAPNINSVRRSRTPRRRAA